MTPEESVHKFPLFVAQKRFNNDIRRLLARYPDGAPDHVIAAALLLSEEDVDALYESIVAKLRGLMGVEE